MEITREQIEKQREKLRSLGIGNFSINGLPEDESIAQSIAETWSFFFVCVKDPYFQTHSKTGNIRFRIFQTLKEKPQIPMGYSGMPLFSFECYDGNPQAKAIELIKKNVKNKYFYSVKNDEITMRRDIPETEKKPKLSYITDPKEGQECFVNWSNCYKLHKAKCVIKTVNRASVRVTLLETSGTQGEYGYYPIGKEIVISRHQTQQNCLTSN